MYAYIVPWNCKKKKKDCWIAQLTCSSLGTRIGFATVSNFMLLLLVQSPTKDHAVKANRLVHMWRQVLRSLSRSCGELVNLGLVRLEGPHWVGLSGNYYLAQHVKEALDETL